MKLVFYDSTCLMPERISGVGVYAKHLYLALKKLGVPLRPVYQFTRLNKANNTAIHIGEKAVPFLPLPPRAGAVFHGTDFKLAGGSSRYPRLVTIQDLAVFHPGYNSERFRTEGQRNFRAAMAKKPDRIVVPCRATWTRPG